LVVILGKEECLKSKKMDYRPEKFIAFIIKVKIRYLFIFNIGFIGILLFFYFSYPNSFYGILTFVSCWLIIANLFIYGISYHIYKKGRNAFMEIQSINKIIIKDVTVYIGGADRFDLKNKFLPDFTKTIYYFTKADLIITEYSILLLGKEFSTGVTPFAIPIELTNEKSLYSLTSVWINYWKENGKTIKLDVIDPNYKKSFQIEFRSHIDEIKEWLQSNYRIKQA